MSATTRTVVRYADHREGSVRLGVLTDEVAPLRVQTMNELLVLDSGRFRAALEETVGAARPLSEVDLLPPVEDVTEVWAAGVTYERSRSAREEESNVSSVYELVYDAERPELFFKSCGWRVVTDGEPIGIRPDSELNVPEAELALVLNAHGELVGFTICDDVSSRSIEGENPLYLPQAKMYGGSCSIAAGIRPACDLEEIDSFTISLDVVRQGGSVWNGSTTTTAMRRSFEDLARWLFAAQDFPHGVLLSTGTGIVPEIDFSLETDDVVVIEIPEVGRLSNVVRSSEAFGWLATARERPLDRRSLQGASGAT